MDILLLLLFLQVKHWYADFKIQTYMQTVKKGVWLNPIGISHSLDHIASSLIAILIASFFINFSLALGILVSLIEGLLHYFIDFIKVKYGCKDNTKPAFWNQFGLDQLAHQACYLIMVFVLLIL